MADARAPEHAGVSTEAVAHCALQVGRILLQNGGDTGQVQQAIKRPAIGPLPISALPRPFMRIYGHSVMS
jgi:hypothetical protein